MKLLSRYIISTMIRFNLLVLVIVLGMEFFILLIGEFTDIGHGNYGLLQAVLYVVMSLPANVYSLFPMCGLLGSLIGLGLLGSHSELVVMRVSGVSVWQIIFSVLKAALILIIIVTIVGEWIAPASQHWANREKILAESAGQATESAGGIWVKYNDAFINIQHVSQTMRLEGITEYQFNPGRQLVMALYAKAAEKKQGKWLLYDAQVSYFSAQGVQSEKLSTMKWPIEINSRILGVSRGNLSEMNLWELFNYILYRHHNALSSGLFVLSFWQRLLAPISSLIMIFLAVPFIFGPLRSVTMGVRIVTGAALGFTFYLLNQFFGPVSLVYNIPPIIGASLPTILFALLAIYFMRRTK